VARFVQFDDIWALHETAKAVLCEFPDGTQHWIPKSQIGPTSQVRVTGDAGALEVTDWCADVKGLGAHRAAPPPPPPKEPLIDLTEAHTLYRRLAAKYHPDRSSDSEETMTDINELWQAVVRAISKA
jgi:hypothetical protein